MHISGTTVIRYAIGLATIITGLTLINNNQSLSGLVILLAAFIILPISDLLVFSKGRISISEGGRFWVILLLLAIGWYVHQDISLVLGEFSTTTKMLVFGIFIIELAIFLLRSSGRMR